MRKLIRGSVCFLLAGFSALFAANQNGAALDILETKGQVIALRELTKEMVEDFFTGKTPQAILECTEGSNLPLYLSLKGEFLALEGEAPSIKIRVLKTCFIKCQKESFFFSSDLENWKEFDEFFTGEVGVCLNIEDETPVARLNIDLNQRL